MWDGSSITTNGNTWALRYQAARWLYANYPAVDWQFVNSANSGWATWPNLVTLQQTVLDHTPELIVFDTANNDPSDMDAATVEAYIRRIWDVLPGARIMAWNFPGVADVNVDSSINSPTNSVELSKAAEIFEAYGVLRLDYLSALQALIGAGHHLTEYMADTIHPNEGGHNLAWTILQPHLPSGGGSKPLEYPARLYDTDGEYENTPTILLGSEYSSRTGAGWSDSGTAVASTTAGDTITFLAFCKSVGVYRASGSNVNLEISVDGGTYYDVSLYSNGAALAEGRGEHAITIRVKAGGNLWIDEFWAI